MTREEFENSCIKIKPQDNKRPTEAEYKLIEYVYMFHPAIGEVEGKEQIAMLYLNFGMSLIQDMKPRAELMEKKEKELRTAREALRRVQEEIAEIRAGGEI